MRPKCLILVLALALGGMVATDAGAAKAEPDDVRGVLKTLTGSNGIESPRLATDPSGYVRFVGAPQGNYFAAGTQSKAAASPGSVAQGFLRDRMGAFSNVSRLLDYQVERVTASGGRTYVRLDQTYAGLTVFGAQVTVQLNAQNDVVCVLADVMRDTRKLDDGTLALAPSISPQAAKAAAIAAVKADHPSAILAASEPELVLFCPSVIGKLGLICTAWQMTVHDSGLVADMVLVNAASGTIALRYPLIVSARWREICDSNNSTSDPGPLVRSEGEGPTGITDVDRAYDYFGDTYDFYWTEHGRDSINNGGMPLRATVRYCPSLAYCPFANAFWDSSVERMYFGVGFVVDDVVGHELTHGVTSKTSRLVYQYESGAINETFSDVWGEFVDLTNSGGTDTPAVRWLMGEDLPIGAIRDMQDPPAFSNWFYDTGAPIPMPDRYKGTGWYFGDDDNGGVHHNCGVGNKAAYLMTDGDTFNSFTVAGMGIPVVADLFYEVQTRLIGMSGDYEDLGFALIQAGENLGLAPSEVSNVANAVYATEMVKPTGLPFRSFRATSIQNEALAVLTWQPTTFPGQSHEVTIVRNIVDFPRTIADGTVLVTGHTDETYVDTDPALLLGGEYFYALFPAVDGGASALYARVVVGHPTPDFGSEAFTPADPIDLAFTQITYTPIVDLAAADASLSSDSYTTYADYIVTTKTGAEFGNQLPVAKENATRVSLSDDGSITFSAPTEIPFFGHYWGQLANALVLSANGFVVPANYASQASGLTGITPYLDNHFDSPRISFLFSDLDPKSGGEVWARFLDDRMVVTFDNVPEYGSLTGNTVQCELFYSGTIRFTYLNLTARTAVVGVSDGKGRPLNPIDVKNNVPSPAVLESDLSGLSSTPAFTLMPVPVQYINEGDAVEFVVTASSSTVPVFFTLSNIPSGMTGYEFIRESNVSYRFRWVSNPTGHAFYSFLIKATAGNYTASQWVDIFLTDVVTPPVASNLVLTPQTPRESQELVASYSFYQSEGLLEEGSLLYWYKGNAMIPGFTNVRTLPSAATRVGDRWHFSVTPAVMVGFDWYTGEPVYVRGERKMSPVVTVIADTKPDANGDGKIDSLDVQMVVNAVLGVMPQGNSVAPDIDGDGLVTAVDVQYVLNATLAVK